MSPTILKWTLKMNRETTIRIISNCGIPYRFSTWRGSSTRNVINENESNFVFDPELNEMRVDCYDFDFGELKDNLAELSCPYFGEDMNHDPDQDSENDHCALV